MSEYEQPVSRDFGDTRVDSSFSRLVPVEGVLGLRSLLIEEYMPRARTSVQRVEMPSKLKGFVHQVEQNHVDMSGAKGRDDLIGLSEQEYVEYIEYIRDELAERMFTGSVDLYLGATACVPLVESGYERLTVSIMSQEISDGAQRYTNTRVYNRFTWRQGGKHAHQVKRKVVSANRVGKKPELLLDATNDIKLRGLDIERSKTIFSVEPDDVNDLRFAIETMLDNDRQNIWR